jgi:alpha-1,4-galacturonosyltransferase
MVRRRRRSVLLLLLALTVLSPLVLYTRRLSAALNPNRERIFFFSCSFSFLSFSV